MRESRIIEQRDGYAIVAHPDHGIERGAGYGTSWPARPFGVRLPSGMIHAYQTEEDARGSQYWPYDDNRRK